MRVMLLAAVLALGLAGCGDGSSTQEEGTTQMTDLTPIRDVWDFGDPAASETRFRALAAEAEAEGHGAYAAEAMTQVARTFSLRGEFDQANAILDEVDAGPFAGVPVVRVRSLLERGRTLNSSGERVAALRIFDEAYRTAIDAGEHFLAGDAMHMAGIASNLDGEEIWLQRLQDYANGRAGSYRDGAQYWLGPMHNNLGWSYMTAERYEDAYRQFELSRASYARTEGKRYETLIADYARGHALRFLDRCAVALPLQEQTFEAIRAEFETEDEYVAEEIALCRAALGDTDGARAPAALAYEAFSQQDWFVESEADRLEALRQLAGN
jgi:tetratricopeptide (TPR) repeat protein